MAPSGTALHSLRFRLLALPLLMLAILAGSVAINSHRVVRNVTTESIRNSIHQTSHILNIAVAPYATNSQLGILGIFLSELLLDNKSKGVVYIAVLREDGTALLKVGQIDEQLPEPDQDSALDAAIERGVVNVRQPLLLANNQIGNLQFGLSSRLLLDASRRISLEGGLLIGIGVLFAAMILLMLGLNLTRRINKLVEATEAVSFGDYSRKLTLTGKDEISLLANHFNLMARSIQLRISEIQDLNLSLEKRVAERTVDLENINLSLQETIANLNETRDSLARSEKLASLGALVAGVAHELNTPIGNALTVASTLQEKVKEFATEYERGLRRATLEAHIEAEAFAAELIVRNLLRADELVSSFKHVAVDQTSMQRRQFQLDRVIAEVVTTLRPSLKKTPFRIEHHCPPDILMDSYPGPIGQILSNLVNNAVIHAFEGRDEGCIRIVATLDGGAVLLDFTDDGCGIPAENLARIFDPFFTTRMGRGGSGLGLNIVHSLVETLLGGSISVSSQPGAGTKFHIRLPCSPGAITVQA